MTLTAHDRLRLRRALAQTVVELHATTRDGPARTRLWLSTLDGRAEEWMRKGTLSDARRSALSDTCEAPAPNDEITAAAFR